MTAPYENESSTTTESDILLDGDDVPVIGSVGVRQNEGDSDIILPTTPFARKRNCQSKTTPRLYI